MVGAGPSAILLYLIGRMNTGLGWGLRTEDWGWATGPGRTEPTGRLDCPA